MASIVSAGTTSATALNMSADTSGVLQLASNNGTVALTISTTQSIGIGTSSPVGTLNVIGGLGVGVALTGDQAVTPPSGSLVLSGTNLATEQTYTSPGASTTIGQIYNYASIANSYYRYLDLVAYGSTTGAGANIRFITGVGGGSTNVERMRITAAGNVVIADTAQQYNARLYVSGSIAARNSGVDGVYQDAFIAAYNGNYNEKNVILSQVGGNSGFRFDCSNGGGSSATTTSLTVLRTSVAVAGSLSKGSGSFRIDHPLPQLEATHQLVHSFIEGPQADLIYRGKVNLVDGVATVDIDAASTMTEGTFVALCRDVQCFTTNESDWTAVRGSVSGNILTIEAEDSASTASISWMVIGERHDKHMMETGWTDENGKVIVEPLKPVEEPQTETPEGDA